MSDEKKIRLDQATRTPIELKVSSPAIEILEGRYQIDSLIGSGATSSVYAGHELSTGLKVALKVLHKHLATDKGVVERFLKEAQTSALLMHPNIAKVIHSGMTDSGHPYIAMELVNGKTLNDFLVSQGGSLTEADVVKLFSQVCAALGVAHQLGVVHRDLKPNNIMVTTFEEQISKAKVLDFGVAKVLSSQGETYFKSTQTGETIGSILYMSPEQCLDQDVDARTDIYSIGCVMYEALTGKPPLVGRTAFLTMNQHLGTTPEPFARVRPDLKISPALKKIVFTAMAKDPNNRQQSIGQLQDQLVALKDNAIGLPLTDISVNRIAPTQSTSPANQFHVGTLNKPRPMVWGLIIAWITWWLDAVVQVMLMFSIATTPAKTDVVNLFVIIFVTAVMQLGLSALVLRKTARGSNVARLIAVCGTSLNAFVCATTIFGQVPTIHRPSAAIGLVLIAIMMIVNIVIAFLLSSKESAEWSHAMKRKP